MKIISNLNAQSPARAILAAAMICLSMLAGAPRARSQNSPPSSTSGSIVITGCLLKRDNPGSFALTTANGKLYYVTSSTVDLSKHSGHTVRITATGDRQADPSKDPNNDPEADEIVATKLEMVSKTCR
jgi:hypothetical protein